MVFITSAAKLGYFQCFLIRTCFANNTDCQLLIKYDQCKPNIQYIQELDITICLQIRKIVLLLDNFRGHNIKYCPANIRLECYAPNMIPFIQPLDPGSICSFKAQYYASFCQRVQNFIKLGKRTDLNQ